MKARSSFEPYVLRDVDHPVPKWLIRPDGSPDRLLSRVLSVIHQNPDRFGARVAISRFVGFLNTVEGGMPGAAALFVKSVEGNRRVQDKFITILGVKSVEDKGSRWLHPEASIYGHVEDSLYAVSAVTEVLADLIFDGRDPSKVDAVVSRTGGLKMLKQNRKGAWRTDTDRRLRLGRDPTSAPRAADPRVHDRWVEGLVRVGASEAIIRGHGLARGAGGRAFQVFGATVADVLLLPEGEIRAANKGGGPRVTMIPPKAEYDAILAYIDGERARLSGHSLADLRIMAADPRQRRLLAKMPLLTETGFTHVKYDRLYRVSLKAAKIMDLFIADDEYRRTGVKRYVTFHYNRHEYVHCRLDFIGELPEAERPAARKSLVAYMGWRGEGMLDWYSAHHAHKLATADARSYNARLDAVMAAAGTAASFDFDREMLEAIQMAALV